MSPWDLRPTWMLIEEFIIHAIRNSLDVGAKLPDIRVMMYHAADQMTWDEDWPERFVIPPRWGIFRGEETQLRFSFASDLTPCQERRSPASPIERPVRRRDRATKVLRQRGFDFQQAS
ncbi:MAG TPA: hypothetical protein VKA15_26125 [Isosphaeraceae bacterium]|nr:hypothetical protein [Isosphaeraceae bacterium]